MKKIIAILMALSIIFCFTACNNTSTGYLDEAVELDINLLKENWDKGEILFATGESVSLPCSLKSFQDASTLFIYDGEEYIDYVLSPLENFDHHLSDRDTHILVTYSNLFEKREIHLPDSIITSVTVEDIKEGNRQVKVAGTLTPGVSRADVESALGIPDGAKSGDEVYTYVNDNYINEAMAKDSVTGKDIAFKSEKLVLAVTFNDEDVVSKVQYKAVME